MDLLVLLNKAIFLFCICGTWSVATSVFSSGDLVQITFDYDLLWELHSHGIGFSGGMETTPGKIGRINYIESDGDLNVNICDTTLSYSSKAVTKLAPAGDSTPEISSDCIRPRYNLSVRRGRFGVDIRLECIVPNVMDRVYWVKDSERVSNDSSPRITFLYDDRDITTLQIKDVRPEDAGWYTCEVMVGEYLSDTGAVEVIVNEEDSKFKDGDLVQITSDEDLIIQLHGEGIGYVGGMEKTLGKIGSVKFIDHNGDLIVAICDTNWYYSAKAVTKLSSAGTTTPSVSSELATGDLVKFSSDQELTEEPHRQGVECTTDMTPLEEPTVPASRGNHHLLRIEERVLEIKELITSSTHDLRSKLNDVGKRLEEVERKVLTSTAH